MLNKAAKLALVATSLAPIFLTLWFVELSSAWETALPWSQNLVSHWKAGSAYLLAALVFRRQGQRLAAPVESHVDCQSIIAMGQVVANPAIEDAGRRGAPRRQSKILSLIIGHRPVSVTGKRPVPSSLRANRWLEQWQYRVPREADLVARPCQ